MPSPTADPRATTWRALVLHWLATSAATVGTAIVAPARWETWAVVALVVFGAVLRQVPLLGDQHAPLEQLSGRQSVLIVIPAFPLALVYSLSLLALPWLSSARAALICATVFCLGLMNIVGHAVFLRRARHARP